MDGRPREPTAKSSAARWIGAIGILLLLLLISLAGPVSAAPPNSAGAAGPVVLVGVPGVSWSDVSQDGTPALWSLLEDGAVGTLAARSVRPSACPADGWLAVSAGRRAADSRRAGGVACRTLGDPVGGRLGRWPIYLEQADASSYAAHPGLLGDLLSDQNVRTTAIGPGAGIALADSDGRVIGEPSCGLSMLWLDSISTWASRIAAWLSGTCTAIWSPSKSALKAVHTSG